MLEEGAGVQRDWVDETQAMFRTGPGTFTEGPFSEPFGGNPFSSSISESALASRVPCLQPAGSPSLSCPGVLRLRDLGIWIAPLPR